MGSMPKSLDLNMQSAGIPGTSLEVSRIGIGTWAIGGWMCALDVLDHGVAVALWGARHPGQLAPVADVGGWSLEADVKAEIDRVLRERITDPVGAEFMAPPSRPDNAPIKEPTK